MSRRFWIVAALAATLSLTISGIAFAHPGHEDGGTAISDDARDVQQHGTTAGHLPPTQKNVDVVSKLKLENVVPEKIADVGVYKGYAYLAAWGSVTCDDNGVHVVDIRDAAQPREIGFIRSKPGSYPGEGIQTVNITTPKFSGDILLSNNEKCNENTGYGGVNLYDVTRPTKPLKLFEGIGDTSGANGVKRKQANETHSVFAWDAGDKAYMATVDNEEATDVDIFDITDPKSPVQITDFDLAEKFPQILQAVPEDLNEVFLHDMVVKEINGQQIMLLSYWDAGYVTVNVDDPTNPVYIADNDFNNPDPEAAESGLVVEPEGNGHQGEFSLNNDYIIGADEDFAPYSVIARNTTDGTEFSATQGSGTPQIDSDTSLQGQTKFVGGACNVDAAVPAGDGTQVAVVERGVCAFTEKVANVEAAGGYEGVIVFNREGADGCSDLLNMSVEGGIPSLFVGRDTGYAFFDEPYDEQACRSGSGQAPIALGTTGDSVNVEAVFDGWGYVHLFKNGAGKLQELDTYAIPEAHDPAYAEGFGDLSVHEVAMSERRNDLAYFSYYSGGFRVAEIQKDKLVEVGNFIDQGGSNFWGVQVFQQGGKEYVAASDHDFGLYIFEYTGGQ